VVHVAYAPGCNGILAGFLLTGFFTTFFAVAFLPLDLPGSDAAIDFAALTAAHRRRAASPIAFLPAALSLRLRFGGSEETALSLLPPPFSICRSSAIWPSILVFCASKPAIAAMMMSFVSVRAIRVHILTYGGTWPKVQSASSERIPGGLGACEK